LVKDEEYLGGLISANDQVILSLELYDKLSKPFDADSDEEADEPLANFSGGKSASVRAHERAEAEEAEIILVQKRLAAAHLGEGQLDALQDRQRMRIERYNSHRSQSGQSRGGSGGGNNSGHLKDLMDLNFDDQSVHGRSSVHTSSSRPSNQGASLSDYSDYESESDEEAGAARKDAAKSKYGQQHNEYDDDDGWAPSTNHRPSIGPDSLLQDDDDDGDDPFADPQDRLEQFTPLRASGGPRRDFTAV
jgi:hypothetical protein